MDIFGLSKSKLRKKLLVLYFSNPEKEFYLRELERLTGFSVGNIRRELKRMESNGVFKKEKKGNLLYYSLNQRYHLYNELKNIICKTIGIENLLGKMLVKIKGLRAAFIYGSFAREEESMDSDIDLFLMGSLNEIDIIKGLKSVEAQTKRVINYTIYTVQEFETKIKLNDSFIKNIMKNPKIFLVGTQNELRNVS